MDKYYTPELEEFYYGFKYYYREYEKSKYVDCIFGDINDTDLNDIIEEINDGKVKVKYLDKEDIESLGFNITKDNEEIELSLESKKYIGGPSAGDDYKIVILYGLDNKEMWIYKQCNNGYEYDLFKGLIKNKSELKKLLKQLGIG